MDDGTTKNVFDMTVVELLQQLRRDDQWVELHLQPGVGAWIMFFERTTGVCERNVTISVLP